MILWAIFCLDDDVYRNDVDNRMDYGSISMRLQLYSCIIDHGALIQKDFAASDTSALLSGPSDIRHAAGNCPH